MISIQIIDSGIGNMGSVANMLKKLGYSNEIKKTPDKSDDFDVTLLPGVGSFDNGMKRLNESGWTNYLKELSTNQNKKILGICLGMQLLTEGSEEGNLEGLSLIPGEFYKFESHHQEIKVPHMGWNYVNFLKDFKSFSKSYENEIPRFYFVHSYKYFYKNNDFVCGITKYPDEFASVIKKNNVTGFQFHPEKSHSYGMRLFKNYLESD